MKHTYIYIALGVIIFILLFWNVEERSVSEAYKMEVARDKVKLKKKDKQIRELFDSLAKQDLAALQAIQAEKIRADRAQENLIIANEKLKKVVFIRFSSDSARAGAISELYPSFRPR